MRPSSPRNSRISSTTARYSVSSARIESPAGSSSRRSSASTKRRPRASVSAAPATARWRPLSATAVPPPGSLTVSVTSATVPTLAYSPSCFGTRSTRSSSPTSMVRVTFMLGKTTMSSRGTSKSLLTVRSRSSEAAEFSVIHVLTTKTVALFPRAGPARERPRLNAYGTRTNPGPHGESQLVEPGNPEYRLPGPDTNHGRALRGRDRGHGGRPLAGAHRSFSPVGGR